MGIKRFMLFPRLTFILPFLPSWRGLSIGCPIKKIELPDFESIETKIYLGFVSFDRDEVKYSFTRKDLP
jgi:hypothetical protein